MRPAALLRVIEQAEATLQNASTVPGMAAAALANRVFRALEVPVDSSAWVGRPDDSGDLPAKAFLDEALRRARDVSGQCADLAAALSDLTPDLRWERRPRAPTDPVEFFDGHANAVLMQRDDVMVGLSLMAPNVRYPDHRHPPEEFYIVLSPGEWRRDTGAWYEPGLGGVVYHEPGVVHSMRSGNSPLLALWFLWTPSSS